MTDEDGKLRISDAERDEAIERLRRALDEGRIELAEFDERSAATYGAKTRAELDLLFDDLPSDRAEDDTVRTIDLTPEERAERERAVRERVRGPRRLPGSIHGLAAVVCVTVPIWLLSSISSGEVQQFWPLWPIGIMVGVTAMHWVSRGLGRDC